MVMLQPPHEEDIISWSFRFYCFSWISLSRLFVVLVLVLVVEVLLFFVYISVQTGPGEWENEMLMQSGSQAGQPSGNLDNAKYKYKYNPMEP